MIEKRAKEGPDLVRSLDLESIKEDKNRQIERVHRWLQRTRSGM
ncbi:MAG: hypothetical protein PVH61_13950 [Candidatus Aminicenantes bacterium]